MTHMGLKWTISIRLGAGRYKWYQSRSSTSMWEFVWPRNGCLFVRPHNLMGHNEDVVSAWGGVCDISHRIGGKVHGAI